jgi:hypothetical protein
MVTEVQEMWKGTIHEFSKLTEKSAVCSMALLPWCNDIFYFLFIPIIIVLKLFKCCGSLLFCATTSILLCNNSIPFLPHNTRSTQGFDCSKLSNCMNWMIFFRTSESVSLAVCVTIWYKLCFGWENTGSHACLLFAQHWNSLSVFVHCTVHCFTQCCWCSFS